MGGNISLRKKRFVLIGVLGIVILCVGLFYWHTQRQATYAKTRELFAPFYEYSGRLTPEEQKRFSEFTDTIIDVEASVAKKHTLPKRESLQLQAHSMTLHRDNPELLFMGHGSLPADADVEPYIRYFSILALISKTKLADLPAGSRKSIISHLDALEKRLTKNSVEIYIQEVKDLPFRPRQNLPTMRFGVASGPGTVDGDHWIFEADGSFTWPEGAKRGIVQIVDHYGNAYAVDLDTPTDMGMTEDTSELYAEIDRLFEKLTDGAFQRLSTLKKKELSVEIEKLFSSE